MRVVVWVERFWPYIGGAEVFVANLLHRLRGRGYEFTVVTRHDTANLPDEDRYEGFPVHRFAFGEALAQIDRLVAVRRRAATMCRDWKPDLVHFIGLGPSAFFGLHAAQAAGAPLLVRVNRELATDRADAETLAHHLLDRAAWVTGVSAAVLEQARTLVPRIACRSSVVYSGVDVPEAPPAPPMTAEAPRVVFVGRLIRDKGCDLAITAFSTLLQRWPRARLLVAGGGDEARELRAQVAQLGSAGQVDFLDWIAPRAVPELMAQATLVVVPSRTEGLPNVALQAAAAARPVVATRVGGLPEVVCDGETGLLVAPESDALAAAMASLLEQPAALTRMGAAAWRRARDGFSHARCADAFDALYRRVAATRAARQ